MDERESFATLQGKIATRIYHKNKKELSRRVCIIKLNNDEIKAVTWGGQYNSSRFLEVTEYSGSDELMRIRKELNG